MSSCKQGDSLSNERELETFGLTMKMPGGKEAMQIALSENTLGSFIRILRKKMLYR